MLGARDRLATSTKLYAAPAQENCNAEYKWVVSSLHDIAEENKCTHSTGEATAHIREHRRVCSEIVLESMLLFKVYQASSLLGTHL